MYDVFELCMPKKNRKKGRIKRYPVWFTSDILRDIELKLKLYKWLPTICIETYTRFSEIRSSLKIRIPEASYVLKNYERRVGGNIKTDPLFFWDYINSLRSKEGFEPNVSFTGWMHAGVDAAEAFANLLANVFLPEVPNLSVDQACLN
ncbi:jg18670 [Pararge aegeria aegeria]|uniref:Jg18670 protein n=1 Tax=Pararge aegeria aegeria TaxID=348720 RepID=A0A8S4S076_9NEOP|nr:jg18670 [Pararge aegeria aegeria]